MSPEELARVDRAIGNGQVICSRCGPTLETYGAHGLWQRLWSYDEELWFPGWRSP